MSELDDLKHAVWEQNLRLLDSGLVILTWGNVSGLSAEHDCIAIKPSGIPCADLEPEHIVLVSLDGEVIDSDLRPSSDTPTHLALYRAFDDIGGIAHSHSPRAVAFAQARMEIPCLGTTHADHFHGPVPITRPLGPEEAKDDYEAATGAAIVQRFTDLEPLHVPGVLVAGHGPFTWGASPVIATDNAIALETIADMAATTLALRPSGAPLEPHVLERHHSRKHGPDAYYGQDDD